MIDGHASEGGRFGDAAAAVAAGAAARARIARRVRRQQRHVVVTARTLQPINSLNLLIHNYNSS